MYSSLIMIKVNERIIFIPFCTLDFAKLNNVDFYDQLIFDLENF